MTQLAWKCWQDPWLPQLATAWVCAACSFLVGMARHLEKNIPDLQKMAVAFMPLGTQEELRSQIIDVAIDRAFLQDPLPTNEG